MSLNVLIHHLHYQIFTLALAPFLFISFSVLCEFVMVPGMFVVPLSPVEEVMHYSS